MICRLLVRAQRGDEEAMLELIKRFQPLLRKYAKVSEVTYKEGAQITYQYDDMKRLLEMTDASGHSLAFTYDSMGRVLTQTDAVGGILQYTYDAMGRVKAVTDPLERQTT